MTEISVADHPRAARGIRRARSGAGLVGFLLGAYVAHAANLPGADVLMRALAAGIAAHCVGWAAAIFYWRAAIVAELETARRRREDVLREHADRVMRDAAAAAETV